MKNNSIAKYAVFVVAAVTLTAFTLLRKNRTEPAVPQGQDRAVIGSQAKENAEAQTVNPVSLQALMQKQYDGRDLKLDYVLAENETYTRYHITYKSGDLNISGILNVPKAGPPDGGFPVLILNHGHIDTSIYTNGRGLRREQDYLARQGFAVLHPDYRNHAQSDKDPAAETSLRLGYVEDSINAVYAVKNSGLDFLSKERFGMLGHSMGGGVTMNTLVAQPDLVKAAVLYAPVSADYRENFRRWIERRPELAQRIIDMYGSFEESPKFWNDVSAVNFLDRVESPILIFHGTSDDSVPYAWSQDLEQRLEAQGKGTMLVTYPGEAHEFGPRWNDFMQQTSNFFRQNLR